MDDLIRRSDALETYADLYDIFDDNKAIQEELHKVFDEINSIPAVESCSDAISREAVSDYINRLMHSGTGKGKSLGYLQKFVDNFPSVTIEPKHGEWIPCEERLPEDIRPVLVTWKNNDPKSYYQYIVGKHFIGTAHYHRGKWYWYSSVTEDLLAEYGKYDGEEFDEAIEVVAWMPLPEPWKGADDD